MTMTDTRWGLPDPEHSPELYADVPLKRFLAWVVDFAVIAAATAVVVPFTFFTGLFFLPLLFLFVGFLYRWATIASGSPWCCFGSSWRGGTRSGTARTPPSLRTSPRTSRSCCPTG